MRLAEINQRRITREPKINQQNMIRELVVIQRSLVTIIQIDTQLEMIAIQRITLEIGRGIIGERELPV